MIEEAEREFQILTQEEPSLGNRKNTAQRYPILAKTLTSHSAVHA
jgi:hypothetical protein